MSQMWTTRSAPALASRVPVGLNARARISSVCPFSTNFCLACRGSSQTWMVKSESAQASSPPSGLNATAFTWSEWAFRSMRRVVLARLPDAGRRVPADADQELPGRVPGQGRARGRCVRATRGPAVATARPRRGSGGRRRPSSAGRPSALKVRAETASSWPVELAEQFERRQPPQADAAVVVAAGEESCRRGRRRTRSPSESAVARASSTALAVSHRAISLVPEASRDGVRG